MEYTAKIKKYEDQFIGAECKLRRNLLRWRPAYKYKENLSILKRMVDALEKIEAETENIN